jgi:hypothetical protein
MAFAPSTRFAVTGRVKGALQSILVARAAKI